jgi:hypothetical protein
MDEKAHLHVTAALPLGNDRLTHIKLNGWVGPRAGPDDMDVNAS